MIVKFGPINSGKSFNLNRTLTLYGVPVGVTGGSAWGGRARNVETAKPFYIYHSSPPAAPFLDLLKP